MIGRKKLKRSLKRWSARFFPQLIAAIAGGCLGGVAASLVAQDSPTARPNIVLIVADDLTCQAISAYREERRLLETPALDRIGREGMRFERCLVTNSICGPSRAAMLTGKYSHRNGFYNNTNGSFDGSQTTFPKLLQAAGYATAIFGKWHLNSDPTGFDHWHILPGQGAYYNPPMICNGKRIKHAGYVSDVITDLTLDWLRQRDASRPFLVMMQHKAPHREWSPALRHLGWHGERVFPEPATLFDDLAGRSEAVRDHDMGLERSWSERDAKLRTPDGLDEQQRAAWDAYYGPGNAAYRANPPKGQDLIRWRYQRYMHDYLGCVKGVDESIGRLLDYLDESGMAENTLLICTSDQGFFLGEHGWFDKRWIFEESLRTPLLIRWPGRVPARTVNADLVSIIDFAPSILQAAGIAIPAEIQGRSLLPLLIEKKPADWRTSFYYHYYEYPDPHHVRPHCGVVTDRYKLVHYYGTDVDDWELLDRVADPRETRSYYADPDYRQVVAELRAELNRLREEFGDTEPPPASAFGDRPLPAVERAAR